MPGLGQPFLPKPSFSSENPYWFNPADRWPFLSPEYRLKMTAADFMYASNWEIWRGDTHMANCVRIAVQRTVKINWHVGIRKQVREILVNQKENKENA